MRLLLPLFITFAISCTPKTQKLDTHKEYTFLALGDSYTIGEAVEESQRWPVQLVDQLAKDSIKNDTLKIIARTGWTTDELQSAIAGEELAPPYDLVSLLIGVNNQYRGYPIDQYKKEFKELLDSALTYAGGNANRVIVVSIPDYGVTPFAQRLNLDKDKIARELDRYNEIADSIASASNVNFFDITPYSRNAENDESLIASDGLHPSGRLYSNWVETVYSYVFAELSKK